MDSTLFIAGLQQSLAPLDAALRWLSLHSYTSHYLLIAATLYLSGFVQAGARIACATMTSNLVLGSCRQFFASPRPYWQHPQLFNGLYEKSWGMPSGHSQHAVAFWGITAYSSGRLWAWGITLCLVASIALSRLFLGLHYPDQVVIGLSVGTGLLFLWINLEATFLRWLSSQITVIQIICIILITSIPLITTLILHEGMNIGQGNGSDLPYKHLIFYTGLLQATGLSLLYVFQYAGIRQYDFSLRLVLFRTLPALLIAIALWKVKFIFSQWFQSHSLIYFALWLHGLLIASWVCLIWPVIHHCMSRKE